ncbi:filamentous hemagglutinin N-terminal domain-containing protein [Campylobacter lari]|uniref:two-partner secretion domain-containing protein n=1 Tax=Campylobacter lari TaxID=201 RepID=UPI00397ADCDB
MLIFIPRGGESNNFDLTSSCKKLSKQILLSNIVASLLFSSSFALPSGGKFTHGTSGSISINGKEMNIAGNKQNSIIQWGGGFNIANGEKVNFGNSKFEGQQNYLNIAHGTSKSTIAGILEAGNNNVFLINPNGVIITKTGTINANRFVASTSSMSDGDMWKFAKSTQAQGASFSPVFKPNPKGGNVVNMGNISAKNVTLQGNKVMLSADTSWDKKNNKIKLNQITADSIDLKGNEVYVDISTINSKNLTTDAKKGIAYLSATGYYYNPTRKYNDIIFTTKGVMDKTYNQYISIGSDLDWWHFAKGWNEKDDFRNNVVGDTFKLTNDIDFKASSGQNYANYWIDLNGDGKKQANEFTNMIVGFKDNSAFTKTFDGQGFTLKNINIDTTKLSDNNSKNYIGLFGKADGANFANINVDYKNGGINASNDYVGGFIGLIDKGIYSSITINNIKEINNNKKLRTASAGGFAGQIYGGTFCNISINKINKIYNTGEESFTGGFAGWIKQDPYFEQIIINNIDSIKSESDIINLPIVNSGGFAGRIYGGKYNNIAVMGVDEIIAISTHHGNSGGFAGRIYGGKYNNIAVMGVDEIIAHRFDSLEDYGGKLLAGGFAGEISRGEFNKISIKDITNISSNFSSTTSAGGFAGEASDGNFENISINDVKNISSVRSAGGFAGWISGSKFENISINDVKNISSKIFAGGFAGDISGANSDFSFITLNNIENITANNKYIQGMVYSGGFAGYINGGKFNKISLNHIQNIESSYTPENEDEWFAKQVYAGGFAGYIRGRIFENISIYDVKNIHAINNAQYHGSDIENGGNSGSHAGGFAGYINYDKYDKPKFNNIYMYFTPNSIIKSESKLNENYAGKFAGRISVSNNANPNISKIHIYHHKKDLTNATADQKYWGNEIQLHPYDDNNQGYIDFKTATLAALNGLKEIDCGAGRKCLVFTSDFKVDNPNITSPDIPDFNAKQPKPLIPNIEDIINEQATLDTDDIISKNDLEEQIIADLKDKFYIVNINILDELLKAYSKIDKDNPTSKAEFLANYLLSKDKYPDDKERLDIAHSMIQSLDFLLAYQDNGLSEASDDKFANKDTKNTNSKVTSKVVEVYNQTNANKDQVNHFIQTTLNNKVNSINEANENFNTQDYYNRLNELALAYNKYVELINKGLANKNDQAFKDISNRLFALIAQAQGETKTIEELINSFEDLKTQASKNSNGHFIVEGDLQALNIPYPILASIKDNNNGSGEIDKPEKPIDPIEPPIDNKPDFSLSFEQSSTFNSIGNDSLDDEEEQEEIEEASMNQKGKTCIVSDNYRTMNPCVVGSF